LEEFVASWRAWAVRPFYPIGTTGPWGRRRIIEGVGFGFVEAAIVELPGKVDLATARQTYADSIAMVAPEFLELRLDGEIIKRPFAALEITKFPLLEPNLPLAPAADPADRKFEICFVGESPDERQTLARWVLNPEGAGPAPVAVRSAERAIIAGQFRRVRLDGEVWMKKADPAPEGDAPPITLTTESEPLPFLVPG
jgi:hypothetical protein